MQCRSEKCRYRKFLLVCLVVWPLLYFFSFKTSVTWFERDKHGPVTKIHYPQVREEISSSRPESLVNLPRNFNITGSVSNRSIVYTVLLYNKPGWIKEKSPLLSTCEYNNCEFTDERKKLDKSSAVVFYPSHQNMGKSPPRRPTGQIWVFYSLEPPLNFYFPDYMSPAWLNTMNWSMTYRLDSDIFAPYGRMKIREVSPQRDYDEIWRKKNKVAVMITSHCHTNSRRELYAGQLKKHGVDVAVLGKCGVPVKQASDTKDFVAMINEYKFVLSFENAFCPDYITEKTFQRYAYDVIIVGRGGGNYSKLLDGIPLINTADFHNVSQLAEYLIKLGNDKDKYIDFLRRKDQYESFTEDTFGYPYAMCDLCRKLNFKEEHRNIIKSMPEFLGRDLCHTPKDLE